MYLGLMIENAFTKFVDRSNFVISIRKGDPGGGRANAIICTVGHADAIIRAASAEH